MGPRRVAVLLAGLLLAGCATPPPAFIPASSRDGVVDWRRGAKLLTARAEFQTASAGDRRIVVTAKETLLTLTRYGGGEWFATGPLVPGSWRGFGNTAPATLAGWLNLGEAFDGAAAAPAGDSDVRTGRFSVRYRKFGAELRSFELVTVATGDRFRVTFSPSPAR